MTKSGDTFKMYQYKNMLIKLKPIGLIRTPFKTMDDTPRWGTLTDAIGEIEIFPEYAEGLYKIERFSSIEVLFYFHKSRRDLLKTIPPHIGEERGVFATRAPVRPNPIGLTHMDIIEINGRFLKVKNVDILDGTPVLDIKSYCSEEE